MAVEVKSRTLWDEGCVEEDSVDVSWIWVDIEDDIEDDFEWDKELVGVSVGVVVTLVVFVPGVDCCGVVEAVEEVDRRVVRFSVVLVWIEDVLDTVCVVDWVEDMRVEELRDVDDVEGVEGVEDVEDIEEVESVEEDKEVEGVEDGWTDVVDTNGVVDKVELDRVVLLFWVEDCVEDWVDKLLNFD